MVSWSIREEHRNAAISRFKETGAPPPEGIRMHGRWHRATNQGGMLICEANDAGAISRWTHQWSDVIRFEIAPVLDDEEFAKSIS
jgi:hypothetical protein